MPWSCTAHPYNRASRTASLPAAAGAAAGIDVSLGSPMDLVAGDFLDIDITGLAGGTPEDLTVELIFS